MQSGKNPLLFQKRDRLENPRVIEFMLELRKLFALLVGSQRSYVDPSRAVGILRGTMGGEGGQFTNSQQDVSEFTHNLLDWLEEAFKITDTKDAGLCKADISDSDAMDSESEKCDKEKEAAEEDRVVAGRDKSAGGSSGMNPMKNLFYGLVKIEGRNQGNVFTKEEPFGQWPLQVNNFSDIHESLNASTAHEHIDTSSQSDLVSAAAASGQPGTVLRNSGQERWFTKLPPVSTILANPADLPQLGSVPYSSLV
jgi:ubiquitin carboxyl-terminal hydrolase 25/28